MGEGREGTKGDKASQNKERPAPHEPTPEQRRGGREWVVSKTPHPERRDYLSFRIL